MGVHDYEDFGVESTSRAFRSRSRVVGAVTLGGAAGALGARGRTAARPGGTELLDEVASAKSVTIHAYADAL